MTTPRLSQLTTLSARQGIGASPLAGPYLALLFLPGAVAAAVLSTGWAVLLVLVVIIAVCGLVCPAALRPLESRRHGIMVVSLVLLGALALGRDEAPGSTPWVLSFSSAGLWLGVQMAARATIILTAMSVFTRRASIGELATLLGRLGARDLGFVLGLAVNLLPVVQQNTANTLAAMRMRGGFRRHRLRALRLLLVTILVNALRYGDDVICAAEARAFRARSISEDARPEIRCG